MFTGAVTVIPREVRGASGICPAPSISENKPVDAFFERDLVFCVSVSGPTMKTELA